MTGTRVIERIDLLIERINAGAGMDEIGRKIHTLRCDLVEANAEPPALKYTFAHCEMPKRIVLEF